MKDDSKGNLEAIIELEEAFLSLDESCIAEELSFKIKKHDISICLPNFQFDKRSDEYRANFQNTSVKLNWNDRGGLSPYSIGRPSSYTDKKVLSFNVNNLVIRSASVMSNDEAVELLRELRLWRDCFVEWIEVLNFADTTANSTRIHQSIGLEAYLVPLDKKATSTRVNDDELSDIQIIGGFTNGLSKESLVHALNRSVNVLPPQYYRFLIRSLKHFNSANYRQCLLDAATATELALSTLLDSQLSDVNEYIKKMIYAKYNQAASLQQALNMNGQRIPESVINNIATPRNNAIHSGVEISRQVASDALKECQSLIYDRLPL